MSKKELMVNIAVGVLLGIPTAAAMFGFAVLVVLYGFDGWSAVSAVSATMVVLTAGLAGWLVWETYDTIRSDVECCRRAEQRRATAYAARVLRRYDGATVHVETYLDEYPELNFGGLVWREIPLRSLDDC